MAHLTAMTPMPYYPPNTPHHHLVFDRVLPRMHGYSGSPTEIPLCSVTNENWRGKNNPLERRRIQNRLNQRAFRERQRRGDPVKQRCSPSTDVEDDDEGPSTIKRASSEEDRKPPHHLHRPSPPTAPVPPPTQAQPAPVWDELAQLINGNFMSAAFNNAAKLGIDPERIRHAIPTVTTRPPPNVAPTLQPVELQYRLAHDPIIDIIPHPTLRSNILRAILTRALEPTVFSSSLRASGMKLYHQGQRMRGGLVVWDTEDQIASWELSEHFVTVWAFLLVGCEDLIVATNTWRNRRGERSLYIPRAT